MRPAGKQIFRGSMEDPEGSYRKKKRDWERHAKGESRHRSPMAQRALIWQIYKAVEIDGFAIAKVAEQLEMSKCPISVKLLTKLSPRTQRKTLDLLSIYGIGNKEKLNVKAFNKS